MGTMEALGINTGPYYSNANDETANELGTNPMYAARNTLVMSSDFGDTANMIPFKRNHQSFPESTVVGDPYSPSYGTPPTSPKLPQNFDPCDGASNKEVFYQPYGTEGMPYYTYSINEAAHTFKGEMADMVKFGEAISGYAI